MTPLSKPLAWLVGTVCLLVMISAAAGSVGAVFLDSKPAWPMLGLEGVSALCAAIGLGFYRGAYREGTGIALACIAGSIFMMTGLTYLSLASAGIKLGAVSVKPLLVAHAGASLLLGAIGAANVLSRRAGSWPAVVKGVLLVVPPIVATALAWKMGAQWVESLPGIVIALGSVAGAMILGGMFCVGVDFIIYAFTLGRPDDELDQSAA